MTVNRTIRKQALAKKAAFATLTGTIFLCAVPLAFGFKPYDSGGHFAFTESGVESIARNSETGAELKFSKEAIRQLQQNNVGVDISILFFSDRRHCDDEDVDGCSTLIRDFKTSVNNLFEGDTDPSQSFPKGGAARETIGQALHTLQDYYSHSNWVYVESGTDDRLGSNVLMSPGLGVQTCDDATASVLQGAGLQTLSPTTGYFSPILLPPPPGKCNHGLGPASGIHNDFSGRPRFVQARASGITATMDYVEDILNQSNIAGDDVAVRSIMGLGSSLAFVVDDTGSMGPSIEGVKDLVEFVLNLTSLNPLTKPTSYLLVRFGDPNTGQARTFQTPEDLQTAVNEISVGGGGDCPEFSVSATLEAIAKSEIGGEVVVFTDAAAKDSGDASNVADAAKKRRVEVIYMLSGNCSPIDPAFIEIAQQSGGQVFLVSPSEVGNSFPLIETEFTGDAQPLLTVVDTLDGLPSDFILPVDSTVSGLTISASFQGTGAVLLLRPDGSVVQAGDPDATITSLSSGQFIRIDAPTVGDWIAQVNGTGDMFLTVKVNSPINFESFEFVELKGRAGHDGLFSIDGQPVLGDEYLAVADLFGAVSNVAFEFRGLDGAFLGPVNLTLGGLAESPTDLYSGGIPSLPSGHFRMYVTGTDETGDGFLRAFPPVFRNQSVKIETSSTIRGIIPGGTLTIAFDITNLGSPDTFDLNAIDDFNLITALSDSTITLNSDETAIVEVTLSIPSDFNALRGLLSFTAESISDPAIRNGTVVTLVLEDEVLLIGEAGFQPQVLNRMSNGNFVNAHFEPPEGFDAADIDIASLQVTQVDGTPVGPITALQQGSGLGDFNENGIPDLKVKFDRQELLDIVADGIHTIQFRGIVDGQPFAAMREVSISNP